MSLKGCRNRFGTPPTGRSSVCSKNQSRRLPTHSPRRIRCPAPTVSTFRRTAWPSGTRSRTARRDRSSSSCSTSRPTH